MEIFSNAMLYALTTLQQWVGSYGLAIVLLTVGIRLLLWPMNSQQTVSMRKMQELQPKLKALQAKHKDDPVKMQQAVMQFYSENKFNPMAGCLPMLVQLPIFIGLFAALNSPEFLVKTANEHFWGIDRLYHTLYTKAGEPLDGKFQVESKDKFSSANMAELTMKDGTVVEQHVADKNNIVQAFPTPMIPGRPIRLVLNLKALGIDDAAQQSYYKQHLQSVNLLLVNNNSKELEQVTFKPILMTDKSTQFSVSVPTLKQPSEGLGINLDVLVLIILYGIMTLLYQRVMTPKKKALEATAEAAHDPQGEAQAKMMKFLPLMFVAMMFFIPMPAGVMLYLVVTTAMMFIQTAWVNYSMDRQLGHTAPKASDQIIEIKAK
ncbi:MAG: YidC/Oxa1 family membrane protein insertase [Vampirovibrionales bacterium]|nr:YidC/Oxa1 family membrane protein insertase [Vampirovibrionales bacterium]